MREIIDSKGRKIRLHDASDGFKGFVDREMQKDILGQSVFSVKQIADDPSILEKFFPKELPEFSETSSGIFFHPYGRYVNTVEQQMIKWFSLTPQLAVRSDHAYQYAKVDEDGYLLKVTAPRLTDKITSFTIAYLMPVNEIRTIMMAEPLQKRTIDNVEVQNAAEEKLRVIPFNPEEFPEFASMVKEKYYQIIDEYLMDLLDQ